MIKDRIHIKYSPTQVQKSTAEEGILSVIKASKAFNPSALHNNQCSVNLRFEFISFSFFYKTDVDKRLLPRYFSGRSIRTAAVFGTRAYIKSKRYESCY